MLAERAGSTATSVLALAGLDAPPRSREHTLVTSLFGAAWAEGEIWIWQRSSSTSSAAVREGRCGRPRGVLSSQGAVRPGDEAQWTAGCAGFAQWLEGAPLDPASLLYSSKGKPRVAVFSIAHLGDAERMFFVSLLLNQVVAWMRAQTGTTSLRAVLYMDEILGYFPPVANPPSKAPLLTLLKQGRAFGLGVVLATQNPVDLDYKGLANTGTWFLGRLQTERDKARMLDGLEGAAAGSIDRAETNRLLSALDKRVFLLHNVHEQAPVVFQTRWTSPPQRAALEGSDSRLDARNARDQAGESRLSKPRCRAPSSEPRTPSPKPGSPGTSSPPIVPPGVERYSCWVPGPGLARARGIGPLCSARPEWVLAMPSLGSTRSATSFMRRRSGQARWPSTGRRLRLSMSRRPT